MEALVDENNIFKPETWMRTLTMLNGRSVAVGCGLFWLPAAACALDCCQISSTGVVAAESASGL